MFGGIAMIPWALANWGKVLALILAALLAAYIAVLNVKIANRDKRIAEITQEVELWKQTYSVLAAKVAEQNAAINKLEEQRKMALKKRAQADKKAAVIVAHQKEAETRLEAIPSVPEASSTCEAEMDAITAMLGAAK
jgi:septal ring factor EnvC (AmiA/AmiB activator)